MQWLRTGHSVCPVCKSGVAQESVIPLYGRGKERVDPRTRARAGEGGGAAQPREEGAGGGAGAAGGSSAGDSDVPNRPAGQRTEPPLHAAEAWPNGGGPGGGPQIHIAAGFGFFPSLFGLQFQAVHMGRGGLGGAPPGADPYLDRVMLLLAVVILFFLLFL